MPENNDSFMDGSRGLGLAIPEEATAKLGPLPVLFGQPANPDDPDNPDTSSCAPPYASSSFSMASHVTQLDGRSIILVRIPFVVRVGRKTRAVMDRRMGYISAGCVDTTCSWSSWQRTPSSM